MACEEVKINQTSEILNSRKISSLSYSYQNNCWYPDILEDVSGNLKKDKERKCTKKKKKSLENHLVAVDVLNNKFRV